MIELTEARGPCRGCSEHYGNNIWQRAEDAVLFLVLHGFITDGERNRARSRINKDFDNMCKEQKQ